MTGPYGSAHDLPSFVSMRQQLRAFKGLATVLMPDKLAELVELERQMKEVADRVDAFYRRLGPRHWTFNDWLSVDRVDALLDETATPEEAERRLIELYQDSDAMKRNLARLRNVYGLCERHHLLVRAHEDYEAGRFDTCALVLVSVMDGFVNDFEAGKRKGLAARDADEMVAWDSVAGHHMGLTNALKPFLKTIRKRIDEEVFELHRHGIVHGSVTTYNNVVVATKAWNVLFAIVDWSNATTKKAKEDEKPPEPGLMEALAALAESRRRKSAREGFEAWAVYGDDRLEDDEVVLRTRHFIDAWQRKQWGRIVPLMPSRLIGAKRTGAAAEYAKLRFDSHDIRDVEIDRVEYTQSSVAEVCGSATIDGTTGRLRLRWVYYDPEGELALNGEDGTWRLAVIAPDTYLVDETGDRLNRM